MQSHTLQGHLDQAILKLDQVQ